MSKQEPMLMESQLTKRVFVVTRYKDEGDGVFMAREKHDVTEQFDALAAMRRGECEWVLREKWPNRTGDDHVFGYETSCGARHTWWPDSLPNFCPTCGAMVKAVKQWEC